jgi:hypothetical protein
MVDLVSQIKRCSLDDTCRILKDVLGLDGEIDPDAPVSSLGDFGFDALDLLEFFSKSDMNPQRYCSGERLTEDGKKMVLYVMEEIGFDEIRRREFQDRGIVSVNECLNYLTPRILSHASVYAWANENRS